jgi:hypothetical protein
MKVLLKTLAIIALLALSSQTVRHAYMLWFEPRGSALDKYDQPVKDQIAAAASLDELVRRYDSVRKEADQAKQELSKEGKELPYQDRTEKEPYKSEQMLREAITQWEERLKEIHALKFYWLVGLVFFVLGLFCYRKLNRWFGLTLLIAGFSEFIYWTSPTFLGSTREFDKLLANKLALSAVSLVLLITAIWFLGIFADKTEGSIQPGR